MAELPGLSGRSGWVLGSGWAGLGGVGGGLSAVCSPGRVEAGTPWVQAPQVSRLEELGSGVTSPRTGGRQPQVRLLPGQAGQWSVMSVAESPGQPAGAAAQRRGPGEKQPLLQSCTSGVLPWGGVSPQGLSPSPEPRERVGSSRLPPPGLSCRGRLGIRGTAPPRARPQEECVTGSEVPSVSGRGAPPACPPPEEEVSGRGGPADGYAGRFQPCLGAQPWGLRPSVASGAWLAEARGVPSGWRGAGRSDGARGPGWHWPLNCRPGHL